MPSKVCMKWWGHSSGGVIFHSILHFAKCSTGASFPWYFSFLLYSCSAPNLIHSSLLHWYQSVMVSLCAPHHLAGVALSAKSSTNSRWFSNTLSSYCVKNVSKSFSPWKMGGSLIFVPTHISVWSSLAHLHVDTSCSLCYQFSNPVSEFVAHEVMLHQLNTPSTVGFK